VADDHDLSGRIRHFCLEPFLSPHFPSHRENAGKFPHRRVKSYAQAMFANMAEACDSTYRREKRLHRESPGETCTFDKLSPRP